MITLIPTRGLIFSQTILSLKDNEIDFNNLIIRQGNIPEVQNELVREALKEYDQHILFIEDDIVIPEGVIEGMKNMDKAIVAVDYPMDNGSSTIRKENNKILWCGLGCTLVRRGVLEAMKDPWFDTSYSWRILRENPLELEKIDNPSKYGGHDINFCIKARELGYEIYQLEGFEAEHLRCEQLQKGGYNKGIFNISPLPPVIKR